MSSAKGVADASSSLKVRNGINPNGWHLRPKNRSAGLKVNMTFVNGVEFIIVVIYWTILGHALVGIHFSCIVILIIVRSCFCSRSLGLLDGE